uniref:Uncharacterized protein n=1 Tax=Panagrolaimus davidi TaxID=227884 RepID=A0A914PBC9_9BILA
MSFNRISDYPKLESEEHYTLLTSDKLWLFSRTFHDQPKYNGGQHVTHKGGYSVYFDLNTQKWSEVEEFNALTMEENVDELVFVHQDKICCLLYSNLGKIEFLQLAVFDVNERQFTMWNEFKNVSVKAEHEDETFKQRLILADGTLPDNSRILIASIEGNLHLFKISIDFSAKQASISSAAKYSQEERNSALLIPTNAAVNNNQVILEFASRGGCLVRWEPTKFDRLTVEDKNFKRIEIKEGPSNFSFMGAKLTSLVGDDQWLHFCGNAQHGMTDRKFIGEVWNLDKAFSSEPEWQKIEGIEVPKEAENAEFAFDSEKRVLYVIDPKNGLFSAQL